MAIADIIHIFATAKNFRQQVKLIVKTLYGAESLLSKELEQLGATNISEQRRAVSCDVPDYRTLYKINLWSRIALRVLMPVVEIVATNDKELYEAVHSYQWHKIITPDRTIMLDHISFSTIFPDSQFLAMRAKDAIVDEIREQLGARPYVDTENPDILLNIHATDDKITISLDASGTPLNRRGYRQSMTQYATNEVLAATLVELSGWQPDITLVDPMCGTGTICIEAAMKARNIAPNMFRKEPFGFMNWNDFDIETWREIKKEAQEMQKNVRLRILGSDIDTDSLDIAKLSTLEIGLNNDIRIQRKGVRELERTTEDGMIITVPPYVQEEGRRNIEDLYKEVTFFMSRKLPDYDAWIYSTNLKALMAIEYRSEKKYQLYNGSQEGNFNMYPF